MVKLKILECTKKIFSEYWPIFSGLLSTENLFDNDSENLLKISKKVHNIQNIAKCFIPFSWKFILTFQNSKIQNEIIETF